MNTFDAVVLARTLMNQHGLQNWQFNLDTAKRRFGKCSHRQREISLSRALVEVNPVEEVRNTILHEIAHAVLGPGHGHDHIWKLKAMEVGARPERCAATTTVRVPGAFRGECMDCGTEVSRHRRPNAAPYYHTRCRHRLHSGRINWKF